MSYEAILNDVKRHYEDRKPYLSKKQIIFLQGKNTLRDKMFGMFTKNYIDRKKLILEANITYAYTIKTWSNNDYNDDYYPSWIIFSPQIKYSANPHLYERINKNLNDYKFDSSDKSHDKKLKMFLTEDLSEPVMFKLNKELAGEDIVYLHFVYVRSSQFTQFKMGINLIMFNPNVSKEVLYVPEVLWTKEYKEIKYEDKEE